MGGMMWGVWLFGLLLLIGVGLLVVLAVRAVGGGVTHGASSAQQADSPPRGSSRARQILDERYARGELSTEDYRERLQSIEQDG